MSRNFVYILSNFLIRKKNSLQGRQGKLMEPAQTN